MTKIFPKVIIKMINLKNKFKKWFKKMPKIGPVTNSNEVFVQIFWKKLK